MSDPLTDLISDIQHNGVRWLTLVTLYSLYRKERRNTLLNRRDQANFANQREVMNALGVGDKWKDGPHHGLLQMDLPILRRFFLFLPKDMLPQKRRMSMIVNLFKTSISKKLLALLVGAAVATLNKKLGLDLTPNEVVTFLLAVIGYILGQSHVDAKKVLAGVKDSPLLQMGYNDAAPVLQSIHDDINKICADFKKNDGSQAFNDAMQAYAQIKPILDALKHPEPVTDVVEDKVAS